VTPKTLVVPLDGSAFAERALPIAGTVAERIGGRLLLLSAQYRGPLDPDAYLEERAAGIERCPVDLIATTDQLAEDAIVEAIAGNADRVVCMTTHGRGRLRWAALGSVAEEVIRRTSRPALLVGRHCRTDFLDRSSHLLACTDGSEDCAALVPVVQEWAQLLGLDVRVVAVRHPLDVESAEHADALTTAMATQFGSADPADAALLRSGYAVGALADYADDLPAAVVGMNCHARSGIPRLALGSVTMGVLQLAPCPVLVSHNRIEEP
jgi:nucleotide-binding universal stress UspA family protein